MLVDHTTKKYPLFCRKIEGIDGYDGQAFESICGEFRFARTDPDWLGISYWCIFQRQTDGSYKKLSREYEFLKLVDARMAATEIKNERRSNGR